MNPLTTKSQTQMSQGGKSMLCVVTLGNGVMEKVCYGEDATQQGEM